MRAAPLERSTWWREAIPGVRVATCCAWICTTGGPESLDLEDHAHARQGALAARCVCREDGVTATSRPCTSSGTPRHTPRAALRTRHRCCLAWGGLDARGPTLRDATAGSARAVGVVRRCPPQHAIKARTNRSVKTTPCAAVRSRSSASPRLVARTADDRHEHPRAPLEDACAAQATSRGLGAGLLLFCSAFTPCGAAAQRHLRLRLHHPPRLHLRPRYRRRRAQKLS